LRDSIPITFLDGLHQDSRYGRRHADSDLRTRFTRMRLLPPEIEGGRLYFRDGALYSIVTNPGSFSVEASSSLLLHFFLLVFDRSRVESLLVGAKSQSGFAILEHCKASSTPGQDCRAYCWNGSGWIPGLLGSRLIWSFSAQPPAPANSSKRSFLF